MERAYHVSHFRVRPENGDGLTFRPELFAHAFFGLVEPGHTPVRPLSRGVFPYAFRTGGMGHLQRGNLTMFQSTAAPHPGD